MPVYDEQQLLSPLLPSDSENVFITLTAREMNPDINIISRASDEKVEKKLMRAGANHVVMPDALGGFHMAHIVTKPFIVEFVEMLSGFGESEYVLDEINYLQIKLEYRDKTLAELDIRKLPELLYLVLKMLKKESLSIPILKPGFLRMTL